MEIIKWIQKWYFEQCDGDWEHGYGLKIQTLDNPGWSVMINIENTELMDKPFDKLIIERNENDWIHCKVDYEKERKSLHFQGFGGPENLEEILGIFKVWAES